MRDETEECLNSLIIDRTAPRSVFLAFVVLQRRTVCTYVPLTLTVQSWEFCSSYSKLVAVFVSLFQCQLQGRIPHETV